VLSAEINTKRVLRSLDRHYPLHRYSLLALLPGATTAALHEVVEWFLGSNKQTQYEFIKHLRNQRLTPLWCDVIAAANMRDDVGPQLWDVLAADREEARARYRVQRALSLRAQHCLSSAEVPSTLIKGADIRERCYSDPSVRVSSDIDILVEPVRASDAIRALLKEGFTLHARPKSISHECSLVADSGIIDLHWHAMRPGRFRTEMTSALLANRQFRDGLFGLAPEHQLFLLLVQPVFGRYSTTSQASLVRLVDLARALVNNAAIMTTTVALMRSQGLATAGWITACWASWLGVDSLGVAKELMPGPVRQRYLRDWLLTNRASRWADRGHLAPLAYTLAAHDSWSDSLRVLCSIVLARFRGPDALRELQSRL